ncbi:hypothetical protein [Oribacterium sp. HCP3S3_B9]|uniref:hypothetical protein n=1 Tax=Oribacterium sp. HCP3S3_B9 TaxID=3438946 RepID=UPI003F88A69A
MTRTEFDQRMAAGLADAKAGRGVEIEEAFESISARLKKSTGLNEKARLSIYHGIYLRHKEVGYHDDSKIV